VSICAVNSTAWIRTWWTPTCSWNYPN
jgi:hypothetical protein